MCLNLQKSVSKLYSEVMNSSDVVWFQPEAAILFRHQDVKLVM